ncbi:replication stress response regulator SDE2-like [Dendronephthya gigantea]|uniref:replication stress response regulator SDE2-like n=1 Tax=Dendronephthya gigantea TaxID=151771 RepID=UPI00106D1B4B|nr:replication stress response regulator SDE2-like [Dendronephthya gigantea]
MVVFIKIFNQQWSVLSFDEQQECSGYDIKQRIYQTKGIPEDNIYLTYNGYLMGNQSKFSLNQEDVFVQCHFKLPGGKGGFGSMLRAIGAQIEKTTNREACRDLSGRRMRDVNDEKKIADWLSKQSERDQEKARRKQERLERLKTAPKHVFEDSTAYASQIQENMDSIDDALQKGLKSSTSGQSSSSFGKRKFDDKKNKKGHKKRKLWVNIDEDLSSDSEEETDARSSCSSMADSDFSISESSGKCSSTSTTTDNPPSGNISENECNIDNPSRESSHADLTIKIVANETNNSEIIEQEKHSAPSINTQTLTQLATPNSENKTESFSTRNDKQLNESKDKVGMKESLLSSNSISSTDDTEKKCEKPSSVQEETCTSVTVPLNLDEYNSIQDLESLGLDVLKSALMSLGLKCGGTLQQRAERLFSIKGIPREKIDPSLFAKPSGKKEKKR